MSKEKLYFRNENAPNEPIEPVAYSLDFLRKNPGSHIYVGTDSQNVRRKTIYATCICYRVGIRGVHVIYHRERVKKVRNLWNRLWDECRRSVEVAEHLADNGIHVYQIDLDYNEDDMWESNRLMKAGQGYIWGLGYRCGVKPNSENGCVATKAADNICRKG